MGNLVSVRLPKCIIPTPLLRNGQMLIIEAVTVNMQVAYVKVLMHKQWVTYNRPGSTSVMHHSPWIGQYGETLGKLDIQVGKCFTI